MTPDRAHHVEFVPAASQQHQLDCVLLNSGPHRVPFVHSHALARAQARPADLWCRVIAADGALVTGAVVAVNSSRKLPWMRLARIPEAGYLLRAMSTDTLGGFIGDCKRTIGNLVLLNVQAFSIDESQLANDLTMLRRLGFEEDAVPRGYTQTLVISLAGDEADLRSQLSSSARRNIGQVEKAGFTLRAIEQVEYVERLKDLLRQSTDRTGGRSQDIDFGALIDAARTDPASSVLVGIFHPARTGVASLVGFAHGVVGTDCAIYSVAGTDRGPDIGRAPLSYGLLWELLKWAQRHQRPWFDFGGITAAGDTSNPLHGISEFKRKFGGVDQHVAVDMSVRLSAPQAALLDAVGKILGRPTQRGPSRVSPPPSDLISSLPP